MFISRLNSLEMKNLFYYIFYRASKFYEDWGEKNGYIGGSVVVTGSLCLIILSIIVVLLHYSFNEEINTNIIWVIVIIASILSLFFRKKKYEELAEKYKDEKNSRFKGWLVFFYAIGSVVLYIVSMLLCGYWVDIRT